MRGIMIAGCFHCGRTAVATCAQCGVGICKECAVKDSSRGIICYKCGNSNLKREHKEYRRQLKEQGGSLSKGEDFIFPGVIGIIIVVILGIIAYFQGDLHETYAKWGIIGGTMIYFLVAYVFFSIPFCMKILNDRFAPRYDTLDNHYVYFGLKVVFSVAVGWIVFTFYLIRYIWKKARRKRGK